jgi:IS30 family transposase
MLTLPEREGLSRGTAKGLLCREIGVRLGRDTSIVSWKAGHDGGRAGYRAVAADTAAAAGPATPKLSLSSGGPNCGRWTDRLRSGWSPTSIAGRSPQLVPDARACRVAHEAIWRWV